MANKSKLTDDQLAKLAKTVAGTTANVYTLCESMFSTEVGDEVFDDLRENHDLFRCDRCSVWKPIQDEEEFVPDACVACIEEETAEDD